MTLPSARDASSMDHCRSTSGADENSCWDDTSLVDTSLVDMFKSMMEIDVRTRSDTTRPDPDDCTVVDVDGTSVLVITDYINESVKVVYQRENNKHCSTRGLNHRPHSITRLKDNQVALCYWLHNAITVLKIMSDIEHVKNIVTQKYYKCVTALTQGRLAAGSSDCRVIDIINMSGKVLKSFDNYYLCQQIIDTPRFMCTTNEGNILVTDAGSWSLYCLTPSGDVLFQYKPVGENRLHWPRGVAVTESGHILFADCSTNKIIQLTDKGTFVRNLLTSQNNIMHPHGLCVHGNKLFVTQEEDSNVLVFDLTGKI